jgi:hypothetical protein
MKIYLDQFGRLSDPIEDECLSVEEAEKMIHELAVSESPLNLEEWNELIHHLENLTDEELIEKYSFL